MPVNDVRLVRNGYTVSSPTAAFGRVGEEYVMRDNHGHRVALSVAASPDHLCEVWGAFQCSVASDQTMPATLFGESVRSGIDPAHPAKSTRALQLI
jgi:hypothetical protein